MPKRAKRAKRATKAKRKLNSSPVLGEVPQAVGCCRLSWWCRLFATPKRAERAKRATRRLKAEN